MKNIYQILFYLLILATIISIVQIVLMNDKLTVYKNEIIEQQIHTDIYLKIFTRVPVNFGSIKLLTSEGDTINMNNIEKPVLVFYFPANECKPCIEENINGLLNKLEEDTKFEIIVTTELINEFYLKLVARSHHNSSLKFGYLQSKLPINSNCYFILFKNGNVSNTFFPERYNYSCTEHYLNYALKEIEKYRNE